MSQGVNRLFKVFLAALIPFSFAFSPHERCVDDSLCLTSFVWCPQNNDKSCSFNGSYTMHDNKTRPNPVARFWNEPYSITWTNAREHFPVHVEWRMFVANNHTWIWDNSVLGPFFNFTFNKLATGALRNGTKLDLSQVRSQAAIAPSTIIISQPQKNEMGLAMGDLFVILDDTAKQYLDTLKVMTQRKTRSSLTKAWRFWLAVGLSAGIPILMLFALLLGKRTGARAASRSYI